MSCLISSSNLASFLSYMKMQEIDNENKIEDLLSLKELMC